MTFSGPIDNLRVMGTPSTIKRSVDLFLAGSVLGWLMLGGCQTKVPVSQAGVESGESGLRIMATYDAQFDQIFDDYQLLSVTFLNQSPNVVELNPRKDVWTLVTQDGQEVKAMNSLRYHDLDAWSELSPRAQEIIEYPRVVLRHTTVTFDLVFPKTVDLNQFRRIDFYSHSLGKKFVGGSTYGGKALPE